MSSENQYKSLVVAALTSYDQGTWGGGLCRHLLARRVRLSLVQLAPPRRIVDFTEWTARTMHRLAQEHHFITRIQGWGDSVHEAELLVDLSLNIDMDEWDVIGQGGTGIVCASRSRPEQTIKIWHRDAPCNHWRREYQLIQDMNKFLLYWRKQHQDSDNSVDVLRAYQFAKDVKILNYDSNKPDMAAQRCVIQVQRIYAPPEFGDQTTQAMLGEPDINYLDADEIDVAKRGRVVGVKQLTELFGGREKLVRVVQRLGALLAALQLEGCFDLTDTELIVGNTVPGDSTEPHLYLIDFDQSSQYFPADYKSGSAKQQILAENLSLAFEAVAYYPRRQQDVELFEAFRDAYMKEAEQNGHAELAGLVMKTYDRNTTDEEDDE